MIGLLLYLLVFLLVVGLVYWVITQLALPEPIARIAIVILVIVAALLLISVLWNLAGGGGLSLGTLSGRRLVN